MHHSKLVSLLQQLHNPKKDKDRDGGKGQDDSFPRSSKYHIEKLAKSLMTRLFMHESDTSDSEEEEVEQRTASVDFASMLKKAVTDATVAAASENADGYKNMSREMGLLSETKKRTENLEKLYQALTTLPPTSVACERVFSISKFLVNARRASLKDKTIDDLVFLRWYFDNHTK